MTDSQKNNKETSEGRKDSEFNFPCGTLEEMLRMIKKSCSQGSFDCEGMKRFMVKGSENICSHEMKTEMIRAWSEYCRKKR